MKHLSLSHKNITNILYAVVLFVVLAIAFAPLYASAFSFYMPVRGGDWSYRPSYTYTPTVYSFTGSHPARSFTDIRVTNPLNSSFFRF